ncbi:hypothetical protein D9611_008259 [Ephemerocybe angulata]|uniref:RING-type domain-containing protein n=1 Tax=Ephemerocybe angulata TaxID=980116 RepID=A0A8H5BJ97_9AGAR|nr:hypothetical protein D9611_008259 [Tulosesus angulatus]
MEPRIRNGAPHLEPHLNRPHTSSLLHRCSYPAAPNARSSAPTTAGCADSHNRPLSSTAAGPKTSVTSQRSLLYHVGSASYSSSTPSFIPEFRVVRPQPHTSWGPSLPPIPQDTTSRRPTHIETAPFNLESRLLSTSFFHNTHDRQPIEATRSQSLNLEPRLSRSLAHNLIPHWDPPSLPFLRIQPHYSESRLLFTSFDGAPSPALYKANHRTLMDLETPNPPNPPPIPLPEAPHPPDAGDSAILQSILREISDVLPNVDIKSDYVLALVVHCLPFGPAEATQLVVQHLLDSEPTHGEAPPAIPDYSDINRTFHRRPNYTRLALHHLQAAFPLTPPRHICTVFSGKKQLYAPTYLSLLEGGNGGEASYRSALGCENGSDPAWKDEEFEREKQWLDSHLAGNTIAPALDTVKASILETSDNQKGQVLPDASTLSEVVDRGLADEIECQCCFSPHPPSSISSCPSAHSFCHDCIGEYAAIRLGEQQTDILCMFSGQVQCQLSFTPSTLEEILPQPLLTLYGRLRQQKELKEACIEGLEECPFCDYACVMEVTLQEMPTFKCQNVEQCGLFSCRICRAKDHPGVLCTDLDGDGPVDGRLAVEEAMTRALLRTCPNCPSQFIKEDGCNRMTCPQCGIFSCYVCRQAIAGYDHFDPRNPTDRNAFPDNALNSKCPLYDVSLDARHAQEVEAAYRNALELQAQIPRQTKFASVDPPAPGNGETSDAQGTWCEYDPGEPMDVCEDRTDEKGFEPSGAGAQAIRGGEEAPEHRNASSESQLAPTVKAPSSVPDAPQVIDIRLLQYAVDIAKNDAKNAKRRLKYAENKLKTVEIDICKAGLDNAITGAVYSRTSAELSIERAMRKERVERAKAECERYNRAVLVAMEARFAN